MFSYTETQRKAEAQIKTRQGQGPKYLSPLKVGRWVGWEQKQLVLETTNF